EMAPRMLELPADIADDSAGAAVVSNAEVFDATIEQGVRAFQRQHGIVEDGAVGARTLASLNVSPRARVEQIAVTLERWRSLPRDFGKNYVLVNVPGESLEVFEGGRPVMAMKAV